MSNIRETSQQDRRVYVGNLSYDVKWHHLKDFMRQGEYPTCLQKTPWLTVIRLAGEVLFADVLLLPNGMSKVRLPLCLPLSLTLSLSRLRLASKFPPSAAIGLTMALSPHVTGMRVSLPSPPQMSVCWLM